MSIALRETSFRRWLPYEAVLGMLIGVTFGAVMFDRNALNILSPFLGAELRLSNGQIGLAASIVSLTWALGGFGAGRLADRTGRRKPWLLIAVVVFSLCSVGTGLATSFAALIIARLVMGLAEGPVPSLGTTLIMDASTPERRGLNIGLFAVCSGFLGSILAPLVLVRLAENMGWRTAFVLAGLPGLVLVVVLALFVRERAQLSRQTAALPGAFRRIMRLRNIWVSAVVATLCMTTMVVSNVFLPLYLVRDCGMAPLDMSVVMSLMGGGVLAGGLLFPILSDQWGRRPILVIVALLGSLPALVCLAPAETLISYSFVLALFGAVGALNPITISIVPGESTDPGDRTTAIALVMGVAELFGGFAAPAVTGFAADRFGLIIVPIVAGGAAVAAGMVALLLTETAPRRAASAQLHPVPA